MPSTPIGQIEYIIEESNLNAIHPSEAEFLFRQFT